MTDRAFMSSKQLDASDRAYQAYQRRLRDKFDSILSDRSEMLEIVSDCLHIIVDDMTSLARDYDDGVAFELSRFIRGRVIARAKSLTPESIEEDYES